MKKLISVFLISIMYCVAFSGCGEKEMPTENEPQKIVEEKVKTEVVENEEESQEKETAKELEMEVNKPFEVDVENGTYTITINEVLSIPPEGLNDVPEGMNIAVVVYTVENKDYNDIENGIFIGEETIKLSDENKNMLQAYGLIPGEYQHPDTVLPGYSQKAAVSYLVNENTKAVDVIINRGSEIAETLTIELN